MIAVVPREDVDARTGDAEVEAVMRIRHNLKLDEPNDFDLVTQDAILKVWDQFSQATFLALVVISSIALMVGGIGVMAIMMISVTERTREIGVRKALGARRREILWQFLIEAAFLTSAGGVLGIILGSGIGLVVHWVSGFPVSLPWWSFAHRHRLLRERRDLLRPVPRHQGLAARSDRSAAVRVARSFPLPASRFRSLPASLRFPLREHHSCTSRTSKKRFGHAGLSKPSRLAAIPQAGPRRVHAGCVPEQPAAWPLRDQLRRAAISCRPISRKGPAAARMPTSGGSCCTPWGH